MHTTPVNENEGKKQDYLLACTYLVEEKLLHGLGVSGIRQGGGPRLLSRRGRLGFVSLFSQLFLEIGGTASFMIEVDAVTEKGRSRRCGDHAQLAVHNAHSLFLPFNEKCLYAKLNTQHQCHWKSKSLIGILILTKYACHGP